MQVEKRIQKIDKTQIKCSTSRKTKMHLHVCGEQKLLLLLPSRAQIFIIFIGMFLFISCGQHKTVRSSFQNGGLENQGKTISSSEKIKIAIQGGNIDELKTLIRDADLNMIFENGRTPLTQAIELEKKEVILFLLEMGADPSIKDASGESPFTLTKNNSQLRYIFYPPDVSEQIVLNQNFFEAVAGNKYAQVTTYLNEGFDPNSFSAEGETGLTLAIKSGAELVVRSLLKADRIDINKKNLKSESPLGLAKKMNLTRTVQMLIKLGAIE